MVTQQKDYSPRKQDDLFKTVGRTSGASQKLKSMVLGASKEEFYGLPAAAEAVSLSQDTLRRAISAGDLKAEVVPDRGREVYQISKSDLSAYLLWRGLPRREQIRLREERQKKAEAVVAVSDGRPTPLQIELRSKLAGRERSARDALRVVAAEPTTLMRGVKNAPNPISPRSPNPSIAPSVEDRIVELIEYARELEMRATELRGVLSDLLVQQVTERRSR